MKFVSASDAKLAFFTLAAVMALLSLMRWAIDHGASNYLALKAAFAGTSLLVILAATCHAWPQRLLHRAIPIGLAMIWPLLWLVIVDLAGRTAPQPWVAARLCLWVPELALLAWAARRQRWRRAIEKSPEARTASGL